MFHSSLLCCQIFLLLWFQDLWVEPLQIGIYKVTLVDENYLGSGAFGAVYKGQSTEGPRGCPVAVKKINTAHLRGKEKQMNIPSNEVVPNIKRLNNPNIIKIFHYKNEPDRGDLWIVMEYCEYTLQTYIGKEPTSDQRRAIILQVSWGVEFLHSNGLAHRDLKPNNVMIKITNEDMEKQLPWPWVKVFDFSYARDLSDIDTSVMTTVRGNPHWMAPELLGIDGKHTKGCRAYHRSIDIYSLGLVLAFTSMKKSGRDLMHTIICMY